MASTNLATQIQAMLVKRAEYVRALAEIDQELDEVRRALGLSSAPEKTRAVPPVVSPVVPPFEEPRPCSRCGKSFQPSLGSSGRFCSRACYAGMSPEERRPLILTALKAHGPMFPSQLTQRPELAHISRGTMTNDLYALSNQGQIENTNDGWQIAVTGEDADETEGPGETDGPLVPVTFPTSRPSSWH